MRTTHTLLKTFLLSMLVAAPLATAAYGAGKAAASTEFDVKAASELEHVMDTPMAIAPDGTAKPLPPLKFTPETLQAIGSSPRVKGLWIEREENITGDNVTAIAKVLSTNITLEKVYFGMSNLGYEGGKALLQAIQSNPASKVEVIDLVRSIGALDGDKKAELEGLVKTINESRAKQGKEALRIEFIG